MPRPFVRATLLAAVFAAALMQGTSAQSPSCASRVNNTFDCDSTVAKVQEAVDGYPGLKRDLLTYLREYAGTVRTALADIAGVTDLQVQSQVLVPRIEVRVDLARAARFGVSDLSSHA